MSYKWTTCTNDIKRKQGVQLINGLHNCNGVSIQPRRKHHSSHFLNCSSSAFPARSLRFTIFGEIFAYATVFSPVKDMNFRFFWALTMECMCVQTRPWFILSSKRVLGIGVGMHVNSKGKNPLYWRLRGGSNPQRCIMQDSEPNTTNKAIPAPVDLPVPPATTSTPPSHRFG